MTQSVTFVQSSASPPPKPLGIRSLLLLLLCSLTVNTHKVDRKILFTADEVAENAEI